jgi:RNA polymerase sigma-70 factor (ECF subfamily)
VDLYCDYQETIELSEAMHCEKVLEEEAAKHIQQQQVRKALRSLTPDQQKVISLKYLENWSNEEIARVLHKPVGAVKSLQHRALASLLRLLTDKSK